LVQLHPVVIPHRQTVLRVVKVDSKEVVKTDEEESKGVTGMTEVSELNRCGWSYRNDGYETSILENA